MNNQTKSPQPSNIFPTKQTMDYGPKYVKNHNASVDKPKYEA